MYSCILDGCILNDPEGGKTSITNIKLRKHIQRHVEIQFWCSWKNGSTIVVLLIFMEWDEWMMTSCSIKRAHENGLLPKQVTEPPGHRLTLLQECLYRNHVVVALQTFLVPAMDKHADKVLVFHCFRYRKVHCTWYSQFAERSGENSGY